MRKLHRWIYAFKKKMIVAAREKWIEGREALPSEEVKVVHVRTEGVICRGGNKSGNTYDKIGRAKPTGYAHGGCVNTCLTAVGSYG